LVTDFDWCMTVHRLYQGRWVCKSSTRANHNSDRQSCSPSPSHERSKCACGTMCRTDRNRDGLRLFERGNRLSVQVSLGPRPLPRTSDSQR
jgi:hypothetical protein